MGLRPTNGHESPPGPVDPIPHAHCAPELRAPGRERNLLLLFFIVKQILRGSLWELLRMTGLVDFRRIFEGRNEKLALSSVRASAARLLFIFNPS